MKKNLFKWKYIKFLDNSKNIKIIYPLDENEDHILQFNRNNRRNIKMLLEKENSLNIVENNTIEKEENLYSQHNFNTYLSMFSEYKKIDVIFNYYEILQDDYI